MGEKPGTELIGMVTMDNNGFQQDTISQDFPSQHHKTTVVVNQDPDQNADKKRTNGQDAIEVKVISYASPEKVCRCDGEGSKCSCKMAAMKAMAQPLNQMHKKDSWNKCKSIMLVSIVALLALWVILYVTLTNVL